MTITSFLYLVFIAISAAIYYIYPKKYQWIWLLISGLIFYILSATPYTIIYLIISTISAYISTRIFEKENEKLSKITLFLVIIFNVLLWFILKGTELWMPIIKVMGLDNIILNNGSKLIAALGMGYYTAQIIGYILDCYWKTIEPQKNILKLFLFTSYFPQLTSGPISRYSELKKIYEPHKFEYEKVCHGCQRILFGLFKKLVMAERIAIIVNTIFSDQVTYSGFYLWIAFFLFPLQMYTDFSGCMDIVIGTSELFGIKLTENFNNPFFSRSIQEFWQRWHISLGAWAKDYVLYPLLKSDWFSKIRKWLIKILGKKSGKKAATTLGMFILWMVMGIWHGGVKYIIGVSLWYWLLLTVSDWITPLIKKIPKIYQEESFSIKLFQCSRTYIIYAIGSMFFISENFSKTIDLFKGMLLTFVEPNPWILFGKEFMKWDLMYRDLNILTIGTIILIAVGYLREKYGYARNWIDEQTLPFRWFIWIALFFTVLIFGKYGNGYDAAAFIYENF